MQKALLRLLVSGFKHRHRWSQNRESSSPLGTLAIHFVCLDGTVVNRPLKILDTRITDFLSAGFYIGNALIMCFFESFVFRNANILVNCLEIVIVAKKQKSRINIALYFCTVLEFVPPLTQFLFVIAVAFMVVLACAIHIINHMEVIFAKL